MMSSKLMHEINPFKFEPTRIFSLKLNQFRRDAVQVFPVRPAPLAREDEPDRARAETAQLNDELDFPQ